MSKLLKKLCFSFAVFVAFYVSGHFAMYLESFNENVLASSALFGASFASLVGGGFKLWHDL